MKYAVGIEYDGTCYHGWQTQASAPSIQTTLERALSAVASTPIILHGAGRTDRGVHATHQVAHFETTIEREEKAWVMGTNTHLPGDIRILWAKPVGEDFHARFSASARRYHYVIYNHPTHSAILRRHVSWHYHPLAEDPMQQALQYLVGEHDFSSFRAAGCQAKHAIRRILAANLWRQGHFIIVELHGNAFLHHMVRNIVGALLVVGRGEQPPEWLQSLLQKKDRKQAGITAPPQGLYLSQIQYAAQDIPQYCRIPLPMIIGEEHHG
jgi:tRNA pseudouridine38-40 synthase